MVQDPQLFESTYDIEGRGKFSSTLLKSQASDWVNRMGRMAKRLGYTSQRGFTRNRSCLWQSKLHRYYIYILWGSTRMWMATTWKVRISTSWSVSSVGVSKIDKREELKGAKYKNIRKWTHSAGLSNKITNPIPFNNTGICDLLINKQTIKLFKVSK